MSSLWNNAFEKQKANKLDQMLQVCTRCKLPYSKSSKECDYCAHLDDDELEKLRAQFKEYYKKGEPKRYTTFIWSVVIVLILLTALIIVM